MVVVGKQLALSRDVKRQWVVTAILLFIAIGPHIYEVLQLRGTAAGIDEGLQVVAARNQYETGVAGIFASGADISQPAALRPLTNWPSTYRHLLVTLRRIGVTWGGALVSVRILLILLAALAWYALGRRVLGSMVWPAALLIPILYRISTHPTDLLVGVVCPLVMLILIANSREKTLGAMHGVVLTVGIAVAVAVKYSALFLIPGVILVTTWQSWRRGSLKRDFLWNGAMAVPALIVFAGLFYSNDVPDIVAEAAPFRTNETEVKTTPSIVRLLSMPPTTFFAKTFKSSSAAELVFNTLVKRTSVSWRTLWYAITAMMWIGFLVPLLVYFRTLKPEEPMRELILVCLILGLSAAAFLIAVDWSLSQSGYARVHRYYGPVSAALIIIYASAIVDFLSARRFRQKLLGILVLILIGPSLLVHVGRRAASLVLTEDPGYTRGMTFIRETTDELRGQDRAVYFGHIGAFCLLDRPIQHFRVPTDRFADGVHASEPAWLFVLHNPALTADMFTNYAREMRDKYDMQLREENGWQVIYKKVGLGSAVEGSSAPAAQR